jgi:hypothetical protein
LWRTETKRKVGDLAADIGVVLLAIAGIAAAIFWEA